MRAIWVMHLDEGYGAIHRTAVFGVGTSGRRSAVVVAWTGVPSTTPTTQKLRLHFKHILFSEGMRFLEGIDFLS